MHRIANDGPMSDGRVRVLNYSEGKWLDLGDAERNTFAVGEPEEKTATINYFDLEPESAALATSLCRFPSRVFCNAQSVK